MIKTTRFFLKLGEFGIFFWWLGLLILATQANDSVFPNLCIQIMNVYCLNDIQTFNWK